MTSVTYIFGDVLTGAVLDEISLQGVSMTRAFGAGELRGTFHLNQTGKSDEDLLAATEPGRCYVVCERDGTPIWAGLVWVRTFQSQSPNSMQLYCRAFEHYPEYRLIRADLSYTDTEQRNIFLDLWTSMMSDPASLQVALPGSFGTSVLKSLDIKSFEFKTYKKAMDSIANGYDGFDWTIDVVRQGGSYIKTLRIGFPTLGASEPIIMYYPGDILNYWQNDSMSERGTHMFGVGAGEGSTMLVQPVVHDDLTSSGFPRYDVYTSFKDVNDPNILTSLTLQHATVRKAGVSVITAELKSSSSSDVQFGSFGLGDRVRTYLQDPRHPEPASQLFESRILGWEYYPQSSEHTEFVRLSFEGEE